MMAYRDRVPINKINKDAKESRAASQSKARELLRDPKFKEYMNDMDNKLAGLLKIILEHKCTDPVAYAFFISNKIKEYEILAILLNKVEIDAGESNEKN